MIFCSAWTYATASFICLTLYYLARVNLVWNSLCVQLLNDAMVKYRMPWSLAVFEDFLSKHELNAQRAFGVKITVGRMRRVAAFLASGVTILLYVLLREEIRQLTAL
jgi:hypothetical protein